MKNFSHSINVDKNKNYVISHTESDWAAMRNNSLISIDDDSNFYTIGKVEELNFITDFNLRGNNLIINDNFEHYFIKDDVLTISYKEYELLVLKNIINKGVGYHQGDILSVLGGHVSVNTFDNSKQSTTFLVDEVDGNGGITKLKIINKGVYIDAPDLNNKLSGGRGKNVEVSLEYHIVSNRKMLERQVLSAHNQDGNTIIELNNNLPAHVISGKLSMSKYIGYLTSNYVGENKKNSKYNIVRDRTPHLGLPLLAKNSQKTEEFFNHTSLELDKKIKEIEDRLIKANI